MLRIFIVAALLALSGCASILTGTSQQIEISSSPPGAQCVLTRQGGTVGQVISTPATVKVARNSHAITVTCTKEGYQAGSRLLAAEFESTTMFNELLGGAIGEAIDSSNGADNRYPDSAFVTLLPGTDKGSGATASAVAATPAQLPQPTSQSAAAPATNTGQPTSSTAVNWPAESNAGGPTANCRLMDGSIASLTPSQCFDKRGHLVQGSALHYMD